MARCLLVLGSGLRWGAAFWAGGGGAGVPPFACAALYPEGHDPYPHRGAVVVRTLQGGAHASGGAAGLGCRGPWEPHSCRGWARVGLGHPRPCLPVPSSGGWVLLGSGRPGVSGRGWVALEGASASELVTYPMAAGVAWLLLLAACVMVGHLPFPVVPFVDSWIRWHLA